METKLDCQAAGYLEYERSPNGTFFAARKPNRALLGFVFLFRVYTGFPTYPSRPRQLNLPTKRHTVGESVLRDVASGLVAFLNKNTPEE